MTSKRNTGLDIVRSIAILIVLFQHSIFFYPKSQTQEILATLINLFDGVSIFFVLSGFLIGRIIIKEFIDKEITSQTLLVFWKRRWLRTLPSYYLVMIVVLIISLVLNKHDTFQTHIFYFFFLQNIHFEISKFYPEAWSLSIEEWFYFIFPLIVVFFSKKKLNFLGVIALFILTPLFLRYIHSTLFFDYRKLMIYRLDSIAYGVLLAFTHSRFAELIRANNRRLFTIGISLLLTITYCNLANDLNNFKIIYFSLEAISYTLILPFFIYLPEPKNQKISSIFYFISSRSYLLYLINLTLVVGFILQPLKSHFEFLNQFPIINFIIFWLINFIIADLLFRYFEQPILNWRNKNVT